jgi:hypothetical protein
MENVLPRLLVLGLAVAVTGSAQDSARWHDPSRHRVQFVTVEAGGPVRGVRLRADRDDRLCWLDAVDLWGADHFVFLSNEADVMRESQTLVATLR